MSGYTSWHWTWEDGGVSWLQASKAVAPHSIVLSTSIYRTARAAPLYPASPHSRESRNESLTYSFFLHIRFYYLSLQMYIALGKLYSLKSQIERKYLIFCYSFFMSKEKVIFLVTVYFSKNIAWASEIFSTVI